MNGGLILKFFIKKTTYDRPTMTGITKIKYLPSPTGGYILERKLMHKNGLYHAPTSTCVADVLLRCEALSPRTPLLSLSLSLSLLCFVFHTRSKLAALQLQRSDHYIFFGCAVSQSAHSVVDFMISSKSKLIPGVEIRI